jgi:cell division protein FtsW
MNRTALALLAAVGSLLVLSVTMLASATMLKAGSDGFVVRQAIACGIGFGAFAAAAMIELRWLQRGAWVVYALAVVLLALTLSPLGTAAKGAQRWLFGTQPSEFAKVALVLALAWFGARYRHKMRTFLGGVMGLGVIALPILGLILVEPDKGTTLLLGCVTLLVMLVAGVRWSHVALMGLVGGVLLGAVIMRSDYAMARIRGFFKPDENRDAAVQLNQSLYAFSAGGVEGVGLGRGAQKFKIPEQHTDFIFPVVGEELGLVATLGVVAAFATILLCGAFITHRAPDPFSMLLAAGITFVITAQACINMGVVTGLLPNKGMALPFVSRGGSGIVVMLTLAGLLLNVSRRSQAPEAAAGPRNARNPFAEPDTDLPQ